MRRLAGLLLVMVLGAGALYLAEHRKADADVSPRALLHFIGDTQRELTRFPAGATRLSDGHWVPWPRAAAIAATRIYWSLGNQTP